MLLIGLQEVPVPMPALACRESKAAGCLQPWAVSLQWGGTGTEGCARVGPASGDTNRGACSSNLSFLRYMNHSPALFHTGVQACVHVNVCNDLSGEEVAH